MKKFTQKSKIKWVMIIFAVAYILFSIAMGQAIALTITIDPGDPGSKGETYLVDITSEILVPADGAVVDLRILFGGKFVQIIPDSTVPNAYGFDIILHYDNPVNFPGGDVDSSLTDQLHVVLDSTTTYNGAEVDNHISLDTAYSNPRGEITFYDIEFSFTAPLTEDTASPVKTELFLQAPKGNISVGEAAPVPEPSTMLLLGSGLMGLWGARKKFKKQMNL